MLDPGFWDLPQSAQNLGFRLFAVADGKPIPSLPTYLARELYGGAIGHWWVAWNLSRLIRAKIIDWFELGGERFVFFPGTPIPPGAVLIRKRGWKN